MLLGGFNRGRDWRQILVNFTSLVLQWKSSQDKTAAQILLLWVYYSNVDQYSWIRFTSELKFIMLRLWGRETLLTLIWRGSLQRWAHRELLPNFMCLVWKRSCCYQTSSAAAHSLPAHQKTSHKNQKSPAGEHRGAFSSAAAGCFWRSDTELRVEWMLDLYFQISRIRQFCCSVCAGCVNNQHIRHTRYWLFPRCPLEETHGSGDKMSMLWPKKSVIIAVSVGWWFKSNL